MQAFRSESTITTQLPDADVPPPLPAYRRWIEALGRNGRGDRVVGRLIREVGEASGREEVHNILLRAARDLTGACRVEVRPVGAPNRVLLTRAGLGAASEGDLRVPIRFRDVVLGTLIVSPRPGHRLPSATVAHLETLCSIAAIGDRLLGREPHLRMSSPAESEGGLKPRAMLLPFLRQLVLLARRRREPLSILAIGLERPAIDRGMGMLQDGPSPADPVASAVLEVLRESDLVVQDDDRTLIAVLPNASHANAPIVAESVARAVSEASDRVGASGIVIGVASFPDDAREADVLLDVAIEALRRAREEGLGRIVVAEQGAFEPRPIWADGASRAG